MPLQNNYQSIFNFSYKTTLLAVVGYFGSNSATLKDQVTYNTLGNRIPQAILHNALYSTAAQGRIAAHTLSVPLTRPGQKWPSKR